MAKSCLLAAIPYMLSRSCFKFKILFAEEKAHTVKLESFTFLPALFSNAVDSFVMMQLKLEAS